MTFELDLWRDATTMIGDHSSGDVTAMIGAPALTNHTATVEVT